MADLTVETPCRSPGADPAGEGKDRAELRQDLSPDTFAGLHRKVASLERVKVRSLGCLVSRLQHMEV